MFIRRTQTRRTDAGECYYSHRLVRSERVDGKVRQITLLNLGRHFDVEQGSWPQLCLRIEQLLGGQAPLLPVVGSPELESEAQRIAAQLLVRQSQTPATLVLGEVPAADIDLQSVDVNSLELVRPRTVGAEQLSLWAMEQVGFEPMLQTLGLNGPQRTAIIGSIIGRMLAPASERATHGWLTQRTGLGELLGVELETLSLNALYRAADLLRRHQATLEDQVFNQALDLFGLSTTITLYDLTNTYFEGTATANSQAKRGHSKEKRSDCPLLTLGLVLDGSGFVRRSEVFAGNVAEGTTLAPMLEGLQAPEGALVVMDRGIATEANITWLQAAGYRYLVVSRARARQIDLSAATPISTAGGQTVHLHRVVSDGHEVRLYCHSAARAEKERAIEQRFAERFEQALQKLADGLARPRTRKGIDQLWERIGRLKEKSHGVGQHYVIEILADDSGQQARAITWQRQPVAGSRLSDPGVYCLCSNLLDWDAEKLWRTYSMLTDLEAVFRTLKSELGLRPVYHHKPDRCDGHLFITVLAYQFVQIIRRPLTAHGIHARWDSLRDTLAGQCRVTASFRRADGRTLHVRKATRAEPEQLRIYQALGIDPAPGGIVKTLI